MLEMPDGEAKIRQAVFRQSDFGALFAGQWLSADVRQQVRDMIKAERAAVAPSSPPSDRQIPIPIVKA